ncbi:NDR1/HIN1-like protein 1 [Andrographis paniculata]|uniref:NDR1/HIN1-like protein 1 n=1 Tax=Andrographis paniculata TaxID=175694 RepID=UPI0021E872B1|nr:NDR1/HIN1-like protein 1 [Andrographis paniculata]
MAAAVAVAEPESGAPAGHHLPAPKMGHGGKHHLRKGRYDYGYYVRDRRSALSAGLVFLLLLAGVAALTVWLLYRPYKPKFRVAEAAVYQLNTTSPPFITTTMQLTVVTRNPNRRVSLYYDHLSAFVSYKNQQAITAPLPLPPLFHETKTTVALSPVLGGSPVPVAAEAANGLLMDQAYGVVWLRLVLTGRVRYKGGGIWSRRNGVFVRCDLYVGMKKGYVGQLPLLGSQPCTVDV